MDIIVWRMLLGLAAVGCGCIAALFGFFTVRLFIAAFWS